MSWVNLESKVEELQAENTQLRKLLKVCHNKARERLREQQEGPVVLRSVDASACRKHLAVSCCVSVEAKKDLVRWLFTKRACVQILHRSIIQLRGYDGRFP